MTKKLGTVILVLSAVIMTSCGSKDAPAPEATATAGQTEQAAEPEKVEETGPSVEELVAQATDAIAKEDYNTAFELAKEAGAIDAASETKIKDMVKDAYFGKIDECIGKEDYEAAYALIKEGNEKSGGNDLDEKLSGIPSAVANDVKFENIRDIDSFIWINFTKKQGDEWQLIDNPDCTYKDATAKFRIREVTEKDIDDNNKEYTVVLGQEFAYKVCYPVELDPINWFYNSDVLTFFDYYTGNIIRTTESLTLDVGENNTSGDKEYVISWNGNDYPIAVSVEKERKEGPQEFIDDGPAGTYVTGLSSEVTFTYKISCPKDYDGLCMCFIKLSALPSDAEQQNKKSYYVEDGTKNTSANDDDKDVSLFENEYYYGISPSSDTLYMMRVDDMANEVVAEAKDKNAATENKQAKAETAKPAEQNAAPAQTTTSAATTPSTGHPLNLDPEVDYGLPDWVKTEEDYAKYLGVEYVSEEDLNSYHPSQEFIDWFNTLNIE